MKERTLWSKDYVFLLIAVFFASFTHQSFNYLIPVYVLDIGGNNSLTGLMVMGLTIAGIFTRLIFGPLIDKVGRKKILVLGSLTFAINTMLYCFASSLPGLLVLRIINGITQGIFFPVPPTLVVDLTPREKTVDAIGYFGIAAACSAAIAPVVGTSIYENLGSLGLFIITTVVALISFGFTMLIKDTYVPERAIHAQTAPGKKAGMPKLSALIEFTIIVPSTVSFFLSFGNSSIANFLAPYGIERNIANISIFFLISNISMIIVRLFTGRLSRRFGVSKLIAAGIVLLTSSIILASTASSITYIYFAAVLFGLGMSVTSQLLQVLVLEMVPENRRGVANSTFMLFGDIGLGVGASVWGATSLYFGYFSMFLLSGFAVALGLVIYVIYIAKQKHDTILNI